MGLGVDLSGRLRLRGMEGFDGDAGGEVGGGLKGRLYSRFEGVVSWFAVDGRKERREE